MEKSKASTNNNIKIHELIYYIYFLCLFGARAVGLYEGQAVYNGLLVLGSVFFFLKLISTRHTVYEYLLGTAILSTGALTYVFSGEKGLLIYFTMMLGMKGINKEKVMRLGLYVLSFSYFILYLLSVTGLIPELNHMNKRSGYGFLLRHSLGYPYPNTTHTTFLILVILFFYLYKNKTTLKLIQASVFAMLINLYLYLYTVSLTGLISVTIYLVINFYLQTRATRSRFEDTVIYLLFPATVIFSIVGPILAKGSVFTFMNKLLHKRYEYALYFLTNEKITPFGSYFNPTPTNWYMLDNSFLYLFLQLGVISFAVVCILYMLWIKHLVKENQTSELAILITFCFIGMSDPFLFNLSYKNITFIFIGSWFYETVSQKSRSLSELFNREILLLPLGEKEVSIDLHFFNDGKHCLSSLFYEIGTNLVKYALIFATAGLLSSAIYTFTVQEPQVLYVNSDIADPYFSHKNIEMTQEDVDAAIESGNLVEGYDQNDPTMYVFKKNAPHMEYVRSTVTCGIFSGLILVFIISAIGLSVKKNH
ncbi:hypothetical protein [Butyrivibrio sp. AE3004]|uniref:hypothetical protein n=1 Tax=Butyrivibrio sp. AE3004 TaxID=1506994 RepID=UPI000494A52E|nr:hypothetical protein [Butyrivibrio sp. AE3004]